MDDDKTVVVATHLSTIIAQQATLIAELKIQCREQARMLEQIKTEDSIKERMTQSNDNSKDSTKHK